MTGICFEVLLTIFRAFLGYNQAVARFWAFSKPKQIRDFLVPYKPLQNECYYKNLHQLNNAGGNTMKLAHDTCVLFEETAVISLTTDRF